MLFCESKIDIHSKQKLFIAYEFFFLIDTSTMIVSNPSFLFMIIKIFMMHHNFTGYCHSFDQFLYHYAALVFIY